jgi:hypothetical protein
MKEKIETLKSILAAKRIPQSLFASHMGRSGTEISSQLSGRRKWYKGDEDKIMAFIAMFQPVIISK